MNVLSVFAGIGGLDLGLQRAGMTVVGQVEIDPFCQQVLAQHWPEVPRHDDIRTTIEWWRSERRPRIDLVCGGFPCQPVSNAGRKQAQADARWLWPEMAAVVAAIRPAWVLWENVPGLRTRGLDLVHADLVRLGYRHRVGWATACAMGAPHPRRRLFGISHTAGLGRTPRRRDLARDTDQTTRETSRTTPVRIAAWPHEPYLDRVAYGVPAGMDRRTALGNAVVPNIAHYLGRLILAAEHATAAITGDAA